MNKTFVKNILRDIKKTKGKVFSIGVMVGLATMVIVALNLTGPSMRKSLKSSLDTFAHPDIIVKSTYPMDYEDKILLENDSDIENISFIKTIDLMDGEKIIRLKSYDKDFGKMNLEEGSLVKNDEEIILDKSLKKYYKLGDKVSFSYINETQRDNSKIKNTRYEVVGFFTSSEKFMEDMRDLSPMGKKEIDGLAFVKDNNFINEKFNEVNISYKNSNSIDKTSKDYIDFIKRKKEKIEDDIYLRPKEVLEEIKTDANDKIFDAENDINDAEDKLTSTEKDLNDAKKKLDDGFNKYEINKIDFERKIKAGENELISSRKKLEDGQVNLEDAKKELAANKREFEAKIVETESILSEKYNELSDGKNQLDSKKAEILKGIDTIDKTISEKETNLKENSNEDSTATEKSPEENEMIVQLNEKKTQLVEALNEVEAKEAELNKGFEEYNKAKADFDAQKQEATEKINLGQEEIDKNQREINQGWTNYYQGRDKLEFNKKDGKRKLEDAYKKLITSKADYEKGIKEFDDKKSEAEEKIQDGKKEIEDNREALVKLRDPEYSVETIFDNEGIDTYYKNSLNMDSLSKVFPVFFYMVAMLVTLTTMKRYIQEQRLINGTLKSLGYTNKMIAKRFYIYGLIPTIIGSIIGGILGRLIIVKVIFDAYSTGFEILDVSYVNSFMVIIGSIILSSLLVSLTVLLTSKSTVNETPARLLLPLAPDKGSKIFLERIKPIWKRLSFMQKITARNLFRYKSRMFMTIFGVAGCTALVFFGFAMIDSLKDTASIQQNEIHDYKAVAILDEKASDEEKRNYNDKIKGYETLSIKNDSANLVKNESDIDISVVVPNNNDNFDDFVRLRKNKDKPIDLSKSQAVLTENASKKLGIKEKDKIKIKVDGKTLDVEIGAIAENYVADYLYLSKDYYEKLAKEKVEINANYIKGDSKEIIEKLEDAECVLAVINTGKAYASMDALLDNLNVVIVVITLISSVLASVVLYNITDINVSERKRELATIKVLGFYPKEVTSYIYREIFMLTILGIVFGYGLGYIMFRYIIDLVAPRDIMLAYKLHPISFIVSAGITLLLSLIILIYVHKKLKRIDMAEAMSSGE